MKRFFSILIPAATAFSGVSSAAVIAFWDFNDGFNVPHKTPQIVHNASLGSGVLYQQRADTDGNGKGGFAFSYDDGSTTIDVAAGSAMAWDDIAKTGDNDAEFFIVFSTAGFTGIQVSFDIQGNADSVIPGFDLKYALVPLEDVNPPDVSGTVKGFAGGENISIFNNYSINLADTVMRVELDLSFETGLDDAPYVALRFDDWQNGPGNDAMRVDNLLITGTAIPEPGCALLFAAGLGLLVRRRGR